MAGPALLAKAAGPIIAAWLLGDGGSPGLVLAVLLGVALLPVGTYFGAVRSGHAAHSREAAAPTGRLR